MNVDQKHEEEEKKDVKPVKRRRSRTQSNPDEQEDDKQGRVAKLADKLFADKVRLKFRFFNEQF